MTANEEYEPLVRSYLVSGVEVHLTLDGVHPLCGTDLDEGWRRWHLKYTLAEMPFVAHGTMCAECVSRATLSADVA
ncbi:MAG: hypothetical protein PSX37_03260 [bacterium]|nr:hypothetical protein [bacterium]